MISFKNIYAGLALATALVFTSCGDSANTESNTTETAPKATYQCPMECEGDKVYESNVTCPVCHMDLKEVAQG